MFLANEWLNQQFPNKEERKYIEVIHLKKLLAGELDLIDFTYGDGIIIYLYPHLDYSKLKIINQSERTKIIQLHEAQAWFEKNYPSESRSSIENLYISSRELTDSLIIKNLPHLEKLDCYWNKLASLTVINCPKLKAINCWNNNIVSLNLTDLPNLKELRCFNNQLAKMDWLTSDNSPSLTILTIDNNEIIGDVRSLLTPLSQCSNLTELSFNNNSFSAGNLVSLQSSKNLESSSIEDVSLLSLPICLEKLYCNNSIFTDELKYYYNLSDSFYDYKSWRKDYNQWQKASFSYEEFKQWTTAGAKTNDHDFVAWLRDIKKENPQWITDYQADYQLLSERFKQYGLCEECQQLNTGEKWCQACNEPHIKDGFSNWTSGNYQIDEFIRKYQLQATDANKFIEWIPYQHFIVDPKPIGEGGFGKVYKALWSKGNIHHWDHQEKQWAREKDDKKKYREVVLKSLTNSQNNTDFLQETEKHKLIDDWFNNIVPCYGLSQNTNSNYFMVMKYLPERDLRNYLKKNNRNLTLQNKFNQLLHIAQGLKDIHQKKLVHRDFHSGNILKGIEQTSCLIADLGLCKPADQISQAEKIYGVMPYVAPEVLQGQPYTQASDIYSWAIVVYELLSGLPPYYDRKHDVDLGVKICQGLRPQFQIKIPQLLEELINRCWANDPQQRPTASELEKTLRTWQSDIEFENQLQSAEENNQSLPLEIRFPDYQIHYGAIYHSKLLPTKEITRILQSSNLSDCSTLINQSSSNTTTISTKQIVQLTKDSDNQQKSLELEIKKMEKKLSKKFTEEQKVLVSNFMQNQKKLVENKKDQEAKKTIKDIEEQLEEENFTDEEIKTISKYCKRFVKSEQELESEKLEAKVEILAIKQI